MWRYFQATGLFNSPLVKQIATLSKTKIGELFKFIKTKFIFKIVGFSYRKSHGFDRFREIGG